jgi:hypothetical protein
MSQSEYLLAMTPVVEALEAEGVPCYIGGSVASSVLGVPRTTLDVDLVADLDEAHVAAVVRRLGDAFYVDEETVREAVRRRSSFNAIHLETMFKVDVFIVGAREYDRVALERSGLVALDEAAGRAFRLASAEDVILHKLTWFRDGGEVSERQWRDVLGVLKVRQSDLDREHLVSWAARLGVSLLLQRAFDDAFEAGA